MLVHAIASLVVNQPNGEVLILNMDGFVEGIELHAVASPLIITRYGTFQFVVSAHQCVYNEYVR